MMCLSKEINKIKYMSKTTNQTKQPFEGKKNISRKHIVIRRYRSHNSDFNKKKTHSRLEFTMEKQEQSSISGNKA